jgi:phytoene dehydrogenase-like protein
LAGYDVIVIGAGHNGLVAAAYLAKAGKKVLVLEQRPIIGGATASEEVYSGFKYSTCADVCRTFPPQILTDLELEKYGVKIFPLDPVITVPTPDGACLPIWRDEEKSKKEIGRFSQSDAAAYPRFAALVRKLASFLQALHVNPPPELKNLGLSGLIPLLGLGWKYKGLGKSGRRELFRVLPLSVKDFLDEWFETDVVKAALGGSALLGNFLAPRSQGTALLLLSQQLFSANGLFQSWGVPQGGMGSLSAALAQSAQRFGATIRTGAKAGRILVKNEQVTGVALENGEEHEGSLVVSAIGVNTTFLRLIEPTCLEPDFLLHVRNIRSQGICAKVNLALSEAPHWNFNLGGAQTLNGIIQIGASLDDIERAFDDAKYGDYSKKPFLQVLIPSVIDPSVAPAGQHVASILVQYAPYRLKDGDWKEKRDELGQLVIDTVSAYAPNFKDSILHSQILTPLDLEEIYGLPEGHYHHADMALDQLLFMRPVPGWARYRTPIEGLYLCGAGTHPGGGVTGLPGYNAAGEILKDLRKRK